MKCYNFGRPGHFAADCNRPKKEDRSKRDEKKHDRAKERSKERRMRTRSDKRPNRKNDRKLLITEESNKNWADSDSDYTSSSSSSSDKDLINALNEMVHEYRKLSQTFEEIKAENNGLKNSSVESSTAQLEDTDSLKTELSDLMIENDFLRNMSCELKSENERLNEVMSSWTKSYVSLKELHEIQKPLNDKSGLGFNVGEISSEGMSTQSDLAYDTFKTMNFVKASVIHNSYESIKYDDQTSGKLNQKGKAAIGYIRPENSKPSWLKNRLEAPGSDQFHKETGTSKGITDSACKNPLVVVSVQYGPYNTYIPIRSTTIGKSRVAKDPITMHTSWRSNSDIASVTRSTTIGKSRVAKDPITMHTSWRSNSDIASVTSIGYPRMRASGESSTTKHRLLHASGPQPIPPPNDPKTNQYNQDLGLIHSTNGNYLESPNEGSSIAHQVTIHLHAQNITMFLTNETWYFASQMLVSISCDLILILTAQSTRNEFRMHSDY
ncbi:hypothetical protein F511_19535 [Dorcoceras hygrometricum]|uniref:CCHC-type domain-containing protein n=1 Tax=Dorcoceras hygrometricum TaxID=472368 RepID=A0A2Z7CGR6_9LAMI|nr:hypothetical protein F511_19535 [Dorcoceras hygrometricum]